MYLKIYSFSNKNSHKLFFSTSTSFKKKHKDLCNYNKNHLKKYKNQIKIYITRG
eukprot:UN13508